MWYYVLTLKKHILLFKDYIQNENFPAQQDDSRFCFFSVHPRKSKNYLSWRGLELRNERKGAQMSQEQKRYTPISIARALGKNDASYNRVTLPQVLVNAEKVSEIRTTPNGKRVCDFKIPISNRGKMIAERCGIAPQETADGVCFAKVSLWEDNAANFVKFIERHPKCIMTLEGSIKVTSSSKDGREYVNIDVSVDQWTFQRDVNGSGNGGSTPPASSASAFNQEPGVPSGMNGDFCEIDDDDELPF